MQNNNIGPKQIQTGDIPDNWEETNLGGMATFHYGKGLPQKNRVDGGVPVFGSSGVTGYHNEALVDEPGYIIGRKGSVGTVYFSEKPFFPIDTVYYSTESDINCDFRYFYYLLQHLGLDKMNSDSAVPGLNRNAAYSQKVVIPKSVDEQRQIASVLSSLDDKIELNRKMNKTLEEIGKALFKHWFVDFEFPNEEGKPYKSSGGEMVDSELGKIPKGWKVSPIGNYLQILDSKRIPLSSRERAKRKGEYRYYGATGVMDYVDDYIFDGVYLLVGEDGTVTKENGLPYTQYVWGKFWANNHAHVLQGKELFSTEFIKLFFDITTISSFVTGAVQPKLNQTNLKSIPFVVPSNEYIKKFEELIKPLFEHLRDNEDELNNLMTVRDSLLPRLMSGRLRVN